MRYLPSNRGVLTLLFFYVMIFGTSLVLMADSFMYMWLGMEVNVFSFLLLLLKYNKDAPEQGAFCYFVVQVVGSSLMFFGLVIGTSLVTSYWVWGQVVTVMGILIKIGVFPFYYWVVLVGMSSNWVTLFLLLTWQKLAPLYMLMEIKSNFSEGLSAWLVDFLLVVSSLGSALVGSVSGNFESRLKSVLVYSSITHMGWVLLSLCLSKFVFLMYFLMYSVVFFVFCKLVSSSGRREESDCSHLNSLEKWLSCMCLLILSGLPPTVGFMIKLWAISVSGLSSWWMLCVCGLIISTFVSLIYYLNIIFFHYVGFRWEVAAGGMRSVQVFVRFFLFMVCLGLFFSVVFICWW